MPQKTTLSHFTHTRATPKKEEEPPRPKSRRLFFPPNATATPPPFLSWVKGRITASAPESVKTQAASIEEWKNSLPETERQPYEVRCRKQALLRSAKTNDPEDLRHHIQSYFKATGERALPPGIIRTLVQIAAEQGCLQILNDYLPLEDSLLKDALCNAGRGGHLDIIHALLPPGSSIPPATLGQALLATIGGASFKVVLSSDDSKKNRAKIEDIHLEIIQYLLSKGQTPLMDNYKAEALLNAAASDLFQIIRYLLPLTPITDPDMKNSIITALGAAVRVDNMELIQRCLFLVTLSDRERGSFVITTARENQFATLLLFLPDAVTIPARHQREALRLAASDPIKAFLSSRFSETTQDKKA